MTDPRLILSVACVAGEVILLFRMAIIRVLTRYPYFAAHTLIVALQGLVWAVGLKPNTNTYALIWMFSTPLLVALKVGVVCELIRIYASHYPGIEKFARRACVVAVSVALAVAISAALQLWTPEWTRTVFRSMFFLQRYASVSMGAIAGVVLLFGKTFRAALSENAYRHSWILTCYFSASSIGYLLLNFGVVKTPVDAGVLVAQIGCYVAWIVLLSVAGERHPHIEKPLTDPWPDLDRRQGEMVHLLRGLRLGVQRYF